MEAKTAETMKSLSVTTIRSIRQPVATLSGGQRQSVAVARAVMWNSRLVILDEPTAALGVAQTRAGARPRRAPRRAGPRGRAHLAQPPRHLRGRRPDHRAATRLQRSASTSARRRPSRKSSARSPRASRRRSRESPTSSRGDRHEHRRVAIRACRDLDPTGVGGDPASGFASNDQVGQPRQLAGRRRAGDHRHLLRLHRRQLLHARSTSSTSSSRWPGTTMLAYGVVFVLLIGEIDLSIGFVSGVAGVVVAELQLPGSVTRFPTSGRSRPASSRSASRSSLRRDRPLPGLDRRTRSASRLRRHARRPLDLAGRDPEGAARAGDRDPGQHGQQRGRLLLQRHRGAGSSPSPAPASTRRSSSTASSRAAGTAWPCAIRLLVVAEAGRRRGRSRSGRSRSATRTAESRSRCCSS